MADLLKNNSFGVAQVPFLMKDISIAQDGSAYAIPVATVASPANTPAVGTIGSNAVPATTIAQSARAFGYKYNGVTWDRDTLITTYTKVVSSAAAGNPQVHKASAGNIRRFWGVNSAIATYINFYNQATVPVIGTDVPVITYPILANAIFSETLDNAYFSAGIAFSFTVGPALGATPSVAAAVLSFALMST